MITCIYGRSASGKTTLADKLKKLNPDSSFYHTDDYIKYGFENSIHVLMEKLIMDINPNKFVEGVQVPRLLRKGLQLGCFRADKIILCQSDEETIIKRQRLRGKDDASIKKRNGFDSGCEKILLEYLDMETNRPLIEIYNT